MRPSAILREIESAVGRDREPCWRYRGYINCYGYGHGNIDGRRAYAHRAVYEAIRGPVPKHLQLDHLCRNRACVNPWHLEIVDCRTNLMRGNTLQAANVAKTHCPQGHAYSEHGRRGSNGSRYCKVCKRQKTRVWQLRQKAHAA